MAFLTPTVVEGQLTFPKGHLTIPNDWQVNEFYQTSQPENRIPQLDGGSESSMMDSPQFRR